MSDASDALEAEAEKRKRGARRGNNPQHPRKPVDGSQREAERARREAERARRSQASKEAEEAEEAARRLAEEQRAAAEEESKGGESQAVKRGKKPRSLSQTWYPDADNEEFLWAVAEAATERRERVPATAVIRLALRRLQDQMTPAKIVETLGGPVQTEGKMGRPRR